MTEYTNSTSKFTILSIPQLLALLCEIALVITSIYLPLYVYRLGAGEIIVGLVGGAQSITYIFMPFLAGKLSDRIGQAKLLFFGSATVLFTYSCYFFIFDPILFIPFRAIEGLGWSFIWPSLEAILGADTSKLRIFNFMWGVGATLAPYAGGLIFQLTNVRNIFLTTSSLMFVSLASSLCLFRRINKADQESDVRLDSVEIGEKKYLFLYLPFLYGFVHMLMVTFFPIYSNSRNLSVIEVGYMLTVMNFGRLIAFAFPNSIKNVFGEKKTLATSALLGCTLPTIVVFYNHAIVLYFELLFLGFFLGITYAIALNKIMQMAGKRKGYYAGIFESILGTGFFLGPMLGGATAAITIEYVFFLPPILALPLLALIIMS